MNTKTQFHFTWLFYFSLSIPLYANEHIAAASQEISYCDQVLIQASIGCMEQPEDKLEACIVDTLNKDGCEIEIVTEQEVNVCEQEHCTKVTAEEDLGLEKEIKKSEKESLEESKET